MRGGDSDVHNFQEYTYKKITPCDVCSQVLRGKFFILELELPNVGLRFSQLQHIDYLQ